MAGLLPFLAFTLFWGAVAIVLHELAHAVTAVVVGRPIKQIDWRTLDVYWMVPAAGPDWRDHVIGWTPLVSGVVAALLAVLLGVALTVPQWIALVFYMLHGGLDDLQVSIVDEAALRSKD